MPQRTKARKQQPVMGQALINDRFGKKAKPTSGITRTNHETGEKYVTMDRKEASYVKMRSVTEQGALEEFLATAEMADTDFTAERLSSVQVLNSGGAHHHNPFLLTAAQESAVLGKHRSNRGRLTVPRRPQWDENTTPAELDKLERDAFLDWRRGLAQLEEVDDLLMTPFERNLEVWRQLWRVIERSDLVVQIVDARNPLLFRSEDLERYVKDVDPKKENLMLVNKADMMTRRQRIAWAAYLKEAGVAFKFFSASLAQEINKMLAADDAEPDAATINTVNPTMKGKGKEIEESTFSASDDDGDQTSSDETAGLSEEEDAEADAASGDEDDSVEYQESDLEDVDEEDIRILTVDELEELFLKHAPDATDSEHKVQIGLVGYPNVGKSSTINALIGAKKVSVSATPGKTKHFQTIHLSPKVVLCDCPGLVFPNFATTKADLVCNGILPIDQMREYTGPSALVAHRIPRPFLEAIYGITIKTRAEEDGGTGVTTAEELLRSYARARGFQTTGVGQPDEARASRLILKDYINGKLLWVAPPPQSQQAVGGGGGGEPRVTAVDGNDFNRELYDIAHLPENRRAALAASMDGNTSLAAAGGGASSAGLAAGDLGPSRQESAKGRALNKGFFQGKGVGGHATLPFHQQRLGERQAKLLAALDKGVDPKNAAAVMASSKKHFKGNPKGGRKKNRIMNNTDD